jgi:hypothetical protein
MHVGVVSVSRTHFLALLMNCRTNGISTSLVMLMAR